MSISGDGLGVLLNKRILEGSYILGNSRVVKTSPMEGVV